MKQGSDIRKYIVGFPKGAAEFIYGLVVLIKWLIIGAFIGLVVGFAGSGFAHVLTGANQVRSLYPLIVLGLPVGGLLIVALYRGCRNTDDRGTNTVMASIQESGDIPFRMAPLIFVSTAVTQLFGGSAGREGAALQLGGSIAKKCAKWLKLGEHDQRTLVMCGMSAGFSALFGTPLAAAVFSLEVVSVGIMQYSALVPCVTASMFAHFAAVLCKVPPEVFSVAGVPAMTLMGFLKTAALAAAAGGISLAFCTLLHKTEHLYEKYIKNQYLRIGLAGCIILALSFLLGTQEYLGSGMGIIEHIFHTGQTRWYTFALKMLFTALTLGAGFKGGEIVPSLTVGAAFGCVAAGALGMPVQLAAACGMAGVFCGVTNSPITSLLIAFELFGFEGMPYYLVSIAVSYLVSGCESLYRNQRIVCSKTVTSFDMLK